MYKRKLVLKELVIGPSHEGRLKFCDVTGFEAKNQDKASSLFYLDLFVFKYIRKLTKNQLEEFRKMRKIKYFV